MAPIKTDARLAALEQRLTNIEAALGIKADHKPAPQPARQMLPSPLQPRVTAPETPARPGNWLGIMAIICFVAAAGFIVKLSIESGWLTPARQIGLAATFGIGLIGSGMALLRFDRAYAGLLPGAGVIVLYLSTFAAHRFYNLIGFESAMALMCLVSAVCVWLYTQIRHDAYAITAAVGAYVSPAILALQPNVTEFSLYYYLFCSAVFASISIWVRTRTMTLVSSYLAILMSGLAGAKLNQDGLLAGVLAVQFIIFAYGSWLYTAHHRQPLTHLEAWSFLPVLLLFYTMEYYLIDKLQPGLAPWISLAFAAALIGLYLSAKRLLPQALPSQSLIIAFATLACFHSIYLELLPEHARPVLFIIITLAFALLPSQPVMPAPGSPFRIPAFALCAIVVIEYLSMFSHLLSGHDDGWLFISFGAVGSMWIILAAAEDRLPDESFYGHMLLGAAHALAVLGLYRLTHDVGSLAVSASWLFYAVAVILFAARRKDEVMAKSALFVLAFAAGKALLYDASSAPTVIRIFCLLLTGAVLYGCGLFMRRIGGWANAR
ncbi:DUF2339 domain-containing protein [bacterium]|nr:DUF2339 domain-containing protein [bacterium]